MVIRPLVAPCPLPAIEDSQGQATCQPQPDKLRAAPPASPPPIAFNFLFYFSKEVWGWAWHFGRMDLQYFHFLNLVPTLGRVKSSIPHYMELGDFLFYFIFIINLDRKRSMWSPKQATVGQIFGDHIK
jgi:hypothetical protein